MQKREQPYYTAAEVADKFGGDIPLDASDQLPSNADAPFDFPVPVDLGGDPNGRRRRLLQVLVQQHTQTCLNMHVMVWHADMALT